ncbi:hypothetical protein L1987_52789 [Smallanthus sonchifolius]|uniref:Uncharacterized protein n=1 Tax=Smallanthus sonchifolius TaxID=185202 RepID=A0ACB9EUG3_9ASTR|nr:hypothetical protein L1987_52789 [Smallanthus sonchifolius]
MKNNFLATVPRVRVPSKFKHLFTVQSTSSFLHFLLSKRDERETSVAVHSNPSCRQIFLPFPVKNCNLQPQDRLAMIVPIVFDGRDGSNGPIHAFSAPSFFPSLLPASSCDGSLLSRN